MFIRSDKVSAEQIPMQIVRSHPASRTGAKMGSIFAPGFHSAGDGMKATLVISPLRRVLETFFGLYTAKGENEQKRRPFKLNYGLPLRSKPFSLLILLSKRCITSKHIQGAFGLPKICRWPKRTAKNTKMFIRSVEASDRSKNGIRFCSSAVPLAAKVRAAFRLCRKRG